MRLTRAGEYAVRAILYMAAEAADGRLVSRRDIGEAMDIPHHFLGKIAQDLSRAGLIRIVQGSRGGYRLARSPGEISLLDVVEAVEGEIHLNDCVGDLSACPRQPVCAAHRAWVLARQRLRGVLSGISFAEMVEEERGGAMRLCSAAEKTGCGARPGTGENRSGLDIPTMAEAAGRRCRVGENGGR